jgi:hypothetical protein
MEPRSRRLVEMAVIGCLSILPERHRFRVAILVASAFAGLLAALSLIRGRRLMFGSRRESLLSHLLALMDGRKLHFDVPLDVRGSDDLQRAVKGRRGVVLVGTHLNAGLARTVLRFLSDSDLQFSVVSSGANYPICGAASVALSRTPRTRSSFLVTIRSDLRAGAVVCALIDSPTPSSRATVRVRTQGGSFWVADPLVRLAVRWNVPVIFFRASLEDWRVLIEMAVPPQAASADRIVHEFAEFSARRTDPSMNQSPR